MTRFAEGAFVPLAVTTRSGLDESLHHGAGIALDAEGEIIHAAGNHDLVIYPRSALKPFQASAMVRAGLDLPDRLLAVVAASHSGESVHVDAVIEILELHGLSVDDLANTPDRPHGRAAREASIAAHVPASSLQQNCSGKHAAMLATCRINDWPITGYLGSEHPIQVAITNEINRLAGRVSVEHIGVDGCGAPTHAMPLVDVAVAMRRLVIDASSVVRAMSAFPEIVGGSDRDVTTWMEQVPGLAAKEGADGVMAVALRDGRAGAFKVADGSDRVRRAVTVELLRVLGVDVDGKHAAARDRVAVSVAGGGAPVGGRTPLPWSTARDE